MNCFVCLNKSGELTEILKQNGDCEVDIIKTHLWFLGDHLEEKSLFQICQKCWATLQDFHQFFTEVQRVHNLHIKTEHIEEIFAQDSNPSNLLDEESVENFKNGFCCNICDKSFKHMSLLTSHLETHGQKTIKCTYPNCNRLYPTQRQLKIHARTSHVPINAKPYECAACSKLFPSKDRVRDHLRAVHSGLTFCCDLCGKVLNSKSTLQYHRKSHLNDQSERIQCQICSHWLKNKHVFGKHMKRHEEAKQENICSYCSKNCPNKKALRSHINNVHLAEKKFKCECCEKAFKRKAKLQAHIAAIHTKDTFECNFCNKSFNYKSHMQSHRKSAHPKEWEAHCKPNYLIPPD